MASHAAFKVATGVPVHFCDLPLHAAARSNENWNGLVRQFLPKGTDLSVHSQEGEGGGKSPRGQRTEPEAERDQGTGDSEGQRVGRGGGGRF